VAPFIAKAGSIFDYLQEVNGIYSIPILTIIVVGYLTKKVPAIAGKIGIISGSVLYVISQFILQPYLVNKNLKAEFSIISNELVHIEKDLAKEQGDVIEYREVLKAIDNYKTNSEHGSESVDKLLASFGDLSKKYKEKGLVLYPGVKNGIESTTAVVKSIKTQAYPHFLHVMAILFVLNIFIMLVIGKLYPREEEYIQEYTKEVDITPWKYTKVVGAIVCLIVISSYLYFN